MSRRRDQLAETGKHPRPLRRAAERPVRAVVAAQRTLRQKQAERPLYPPHRRCFYEKATAPV